MKTGEEIVEGWTLFQGYEVLAPEAAAEINTAIAEAVAGERERCKKIAEDKQIECSQSEYWAVRQAAEYCEEIADEIARGEVGK